MDATDKVKMMITDPENLKEFMTRKDVTLLMAICLMYFIWTFSYKLGKDLAFRDMGKQTVENK